MEQRTSDYQSNKGFNNGSHPATSHAADERDHKASGLTDFSVTRRLLQDIADTQSYTACKQPPKNESFSTTPSSTVSAAALDSSKKHSSEEPSEDYTETEDSDDDSDGESSVNSSSGNNAIEEPKKPKRMRTAYSNFQLDQLELAFTQTQYPDVFVREDLSNRLGIKEDRIQVWFQNRRARFRKQERTGSVSLRSRYRQRRVQKALQQSQPPMSMYPGFMAPSGRGSSMLLPSPQPISHYMSSFPFPTGQLPTSASTSTSSPDLAVPNPLPTPSHSFLPGFHSFRPPFTLPGLVPQNLGLQS